MTKPVLDLTKPLETVNGRKVRLISIEGVEPYVLVGYIGLNDQPDTWKADGSYSPVSSGSSRLDLRNVEEPIVRYFNIYAGNIIYQHNSRKEADKRTSSKRRLGCQRVVFTPGTWDN